MFRTVGVTAKQCSQLVRSPAFNRRGFGFALGYSVRRRMTIGLSGFTVAAVGTYYGCRKIYRNRKAKKMALAAIVPKEEEVVIAEPVLSEVSEELPVEEVVAEAEKAVEAVVEENVQPEESIQEDEVITEVEDGVYQPWWTGVKEISLFLSPEDSTVIDEQFPALCAYKPRRKVMLSYNPRPEDANEFGPIMGDEVEVKVIAMVSDEHAQVLVVDIGETESAYRYPHIVLSCDDEDRASAYSSVYGRLLVDRCVMDGLLVEESPNVYVPREEVENVVIEGYYSYPETHVTVKDVRDQGLSFKTRLCTARGMNEGFECSEGKNNRECSWCVFMKSGPCFKPFEVWQKCILDNQEDADSFIANCGAITMELKECVDAHPEYYGRMSQKSEEKEETEKGEEVTEKGEEIEQSEEVPEQVEEVTEPVNEEIKHPEQVKDLSE